MKPVLKLWYTTKGELRLLKEWIECPPENISIYADMAAYSSWTRQINRIKSESLPVMNGKEILMEIWRTGNNMPIEFKHFTGSENAYFDLPGATWEEQRSRVESDEIFYAFIHLPKAENSAELILGPGT